MQLAPPEIALFVGTLLAGLAILVSFRARPARRLRNLMAASILLVSLAAVSIRDEESRSRPVPGTPRQRARGEFAGSESCRACHPGEFSSWHASFHRTMTQIPTPEIVIGDFDDVHLESRGLRYHLTRDDEGFWVEMMDPGWDFETYTFKKKRDPAIEPPRRRCRVVLCTGSHHQQTYWVAIDGGRGLWQFPWYWVVEAERWAPREDVFLVPPDDGRMIAVWNHRCIKCHATGGRPGMSRKTLVADTEVVELGIACEACHGPAAEHVAVNGNPLRRYRHHLTAGGDPTVVNPSRLEPARSIEVCGQCHLFGLRKDREGYLFGGRKHEDYRPGKRLEDSRNVYTFGPGMNPRGARFWEDGTCRVGGREYNGLIESKCFTEGGMTCVSCHSMHAGSRDGQLAEAMDTDRACVQCHDSIANDVEAHTHHSAESSGSRCFNCHMPHSSYALLKAIRSHTIDSPTLKQTQEKGRPNACNLCHLDRSVAWAGKHLSDWYGQPAPTGEALDSAPAAGVQWALEGDAVMRGLTAWSMGWEPAREASRGTDWFAPYLAELLSDPYSTIRYVAHRSLRRMPGFADLEFDFVAPSRERDLVKQSALEIWLRTLPVLPSPGRAVLFDAKGRLDRRAFLRHLARRDNSPVGINE